MDYQLMYKLILVFLYSLFATYVAGYYLCRKFKKKGFVVKDFYKKNKIKVANLGGVAILVGILVSIVLSQLIVHQFSTQNLLIFYFVVITYACFGWLDDLINISNKIKVIAPFFMALPIALLNKDAIVPLLFTSVDLGTIAVYVIAPIYLMVVTNLINMHSGYNGLASGLSFIILFFLGLRTVLIGDVSNLFYLMPIIGGVFVYHFFDRYPAKMIWGNVGSLMVGSAIGAYIVLTRAYWFGIVILTPHIVDFLLYLYSITFAKEKFEEVKFGNIRRDEVIVPSTPYKLKFLLPYYFRLTERKTVYLLYLITIVFGVIGVVMGL